MIILLSEDAAKNAGNFVMRKFLHQQIKQYIFLSCLLSDHELLDCLLHLFTLRIIIYSFLQFSCIQLCNKSDTVVLCSKAYLLTSSLSSPVIDNVILSLPESHETVLLLLTSNFLLIFYDQIVIIGSYIAFTETISHDKRRNTSFRFTRFCMKRSSF